MQTSPLDGLHDIIAPTHVDWWPLAPAWWVVISIALCLVCGLIIIMYKNYQFKKAKRNAIKLANQQQSAQQLHIILKRLVITYYDPRLAAQSTANWCKTLSQLGAIGFSEDEIASLYSTAQTPPALSDKFRQAIKQFKLKEPLHV
ncbi:hypothetical protein P20311_3076 [Pseudoalteromonas sp. BSi20311]|uniref:DUF4381 domain-containing protein n=1 Tax=unclassified Pseudoalteromonas TaxID=194690 RepID=UPI0002317C2A|nr:MULTISPECIES: DUF4381 domain-containing protein [unclassified Pseudoalteromonas]GAA65267.1 hypothetical protein P20311_3076 [Pseudoalteromonas sp. BSi20311]GAA72054.1 hypothetical protein P20439_2138 [Pseudoalteromonas sp. BSi20439]